MSRDPWPNSAGVSGFGRRGMVVTPSDSEDQSVVFKAVTVLVAGTLAIVPEGNEDDDIISYGSVPIGFTPPFIVRRVMLTGTSATVIGVYD